MFKSNFLVAIFISLLLLLNGCAGVVTKASTLQGDIDPMIGAINSPVEMVVYGNVLETTIFKSKLKNEFQKRNKIVNIHDFPYDPASLSGDMLMVISKWDGLNIILTLGYKEWFGFDILAMPYSVCYSGSIFNWKTLALDGIATYKSSMSEKGGPFAEAAFGCQERIRNEVFLIFLKDILKGWDKYCYKGPVLSYDEKFMKAMGYVINKQYDEAIGEFKILLSINPDYAGAHLGLGKAYYEKGQYSGAIEEYRKALASDPDDIVALNWIGLAYMKTGEFEKAVEVFAKAARLNPNYISPKDNLRKAYAALDEKDKSRIRETERLDMPRIAVVPFASSDTELSLKTTDMLITGFTQTDRFRIIERSRLDEVLKEQKLTISGVVDETAAVKIGKLLGVDFTVIGSIARLGSSYELDTRLIKIETAEVILADSISCKDESDLRANINSLIERMCRNPKLNK